MADAEPEEEGDEAPAQDEAGPVDLGLAAEDGPAEAVDDADHGVEGVEQPPLLGDDAGLQQRPGEADDGLLVAPGDVAPGEDVEQLAVAPERSRQ